MWIVATTSLNQLSASLKLFGPTQLAFGKIVKITLELRKLG